MFRWLTVLCVLAVASPVRSQEFVGKLRFTEVGCEAPRKCYLAEPFGFKSQTIGNWETPANTWTNGASIPTKVLQRALGKPFDADLIRAAVIHDHYTDRKVRSWSDTQWVFYEALRAGGVARIRAQTMYVGLLLGAEIWISVRRGEPCKLTEACVQSAGDTPLPFGGERLVGADGAVYWVRKAREKDASLEKELAQAEKELKQTEGELSRRELEAIAKNLRPNDRFLNGPDVIVQRAPKKSNSPVK